MIGAKWELKREIPNLDKSLNKSAENWLIRSQFSHTARSHELDLYVLKLDLESKMDGWMYT